MRFSQVLFSSSLKARPYFVTTPIFYVNAQPHIGHLYSAVIADAVARFERLREPACAVRLSTGTDEHGSKVLLAAAGHAQAPAAYCDRVSAQYRALFTQAGVAFTHFVRTTGEDHQQAVHHFWKELKSRGYIYTSQYAGWYCVSDESFLTESHLREEVREGRAVKVSQESGHAVEWTEEQNYMFRLSAFKEDLRHWLSQEGVIEPAKFQRIVLKLLGEEFLPDVSVSRPLARVPWAVPVPGDPSQGVYVWLDALVSYLTAAGYPRLADHGHAWPADLHVVGKDILKFHAVYWPAFLMACGLSPPRRILCHSHWTVEGRKMSKSLRNVVCPHAAPGGLEALRYFLLREGTLHSDANYSETKMVRVLNSQLADTLGNLLSRCTGLALNPRQEVPPLHDEEFHILRQGEVAARLVSLVDGLPEVCHEHYSNFQFYRVVDAVVAALHAANLFFETHKPWEVRKRPERQKELDVLLHVTMETLRVCSIVLQPVVPQLAERILCKLAVPAHLRHWEQLQPSWQDGLIAESRSLGPAKTLIFQRIPSTADKDLKSSQSRQTQ